jgi:hypothetical protein
MLLDQEVIPGYEFPHMRIIYALVMLIPFLHGIAVLATLHRIRLWQSSPQRPTRMQVARYIALSLLWNAAIACTLLVILPKAFAANVSTVILFQPDVGWVATASGIFAIVWGVLRTGIVISTFRHVFEKQKKNQLSGMVT